MRVAALGLLLCITLPATDSQLLPTGLASFLSSVFRPGRVPSRALAHRKYNRRVPPLRPRRRKTAPKRVPPRAPHHQIPPAVNTHYSNYIALTTTARPSTTRTSFTITTTTTTTRTSTWRSTPARTSRTSTSRAPILYTSPPLHQGWEPLHQAPDSLAPPVHQLQTSAPLLHQHQGSNPEPTYKPPSHPPKDQQPLTSKRPARPRPRPAVIRHKPAVIRTVPAVIRTVPAVIRTVPAVTSNEHDPPHQSLFQSVTPLKIQESLKTLTTNTRGDALGGMSQFSLFDRPRRKIVPRRFKGGDKREQEAAVEEEERCGDRCRYGDDMSFHSPLPTPPSHTPHTPHSYSREEEHQGNSVFAVKEDEGLDGYIIPMLRHRGDISLPVSEMESFNAASNQETIRSIPAMFRSLLQQPPDWINKDYW